MTRPYKPNPDFIKKLAVSPKVAQAVRAKAEKAKEIAEGIAQNFRVTGEYAESFEVTTPTVEFTGQHAGPRVVGRLTNTSGHAAPVEWGYHGRAGDETTSAHRVLGRTLDSLGDA